MAAKDKPIMPSDVQEKFMADLYRLGETADKYGVFMDVFLTTPVDKTRRGVVTRRYFNHQEKRINDSIISLVQKSTDNNFQEGSESQPN